MLIVIRRRLWLRWFATLMAMVLAWQILDTAHPGWAARSMATVANINRLLPIYSVEREDKVVALSFDAAWGADHTDELLAILKRENVRATFFLVGFWIEKFPELAYKIAQAGHEIGNHSSTHPHMSTLTAEQIVTEIKHTHALIEETTGQTAQLFRPPFGDYNNLLITTLTALGYYTIQWSIDSLDWQRQATAQSIYERVTSRIQSGDIVLFHNNAPYTREALLPIIITLKREGYAFVPISELLLREDSYIDKATGRQRRKR
ncbi:MAG: polysaccharide deacetylase family protein [Peptococcaceae bacterium]|nr:polysaccharide deacetylase family protein [Peptococcaceae bacterium]